MCCTLHIIFIYFVKHKRLSKDVNKRYNAIFRINEAALGDAVMVKTIDIGCLLPTGVSDGGRR